MRNSASSGFSLRAAIDSRFAENDNAVLRAHAKGFVTASWTANGYTYVLTMQGNATISINICSDQRCSDVDFGIVV